MSSDELGCTTFAKLQDAKPEELMNYLRIKISVFKELISKRRGAFRDPEKALDWVEHFLEAWRLIKSKAIVSNYIVAQVNKIRDFKYTLMEEANELVVRKLSTTKK